MHTLGIEKGGLDITFDYLVSLFGPSRQREDFRAGVDYADYAEMERDYKLRGTITVNTDHSEQTIFGTARRNWEFRFWHDMAHLAVGAGFDAEGERAAAEWQKSQVRALQGPSDADKERWCALIDVEVNGQVDYYLANNDFPKDQREFAVKELTARGWDVARFPQTLEGLLIEY